MDELLHIKPSLQKRQKRRDKRLDEELIECYRRGWRIKDKGGYKHRMKQNQYEDARKREGIKFMHKGTRMFNDNLEPLIRYLQTNTGRPWNKVYSELCKSLGKRTVSGMHVFEHIFDFVYLHVWLEDRKVYALKWGKKIELRSGGTWKKFYVHPQTGLLKQAKNN